MADIEAVNQVVAAGKKIARANLIERQGGKTGLRENARLAMWCALAMTGLSVVSAAEPDWQGACARALAEPFSPPPLSPRLNAAELASCDEQDLYYGLTRAADPAAALQCGLHQRAQTRANDGNPFRGAGVLAMLYANGRGVVRDIDQAIRFACENEWAAPAETAARLKHFEAMRVAGIAAGSFDLCDHATSGLMGGACANVRSRRDNLGRASRLAEIQASWTAPMKERYAAVAAAETAFSDARSRHEVDQTGTARTSFVIRERDVLHEQQLINLQAFAKGDLPAASARQAAAVDEELNAVFQQLMRQSARAWENTTVTPQGIRETERAWIVMRDAWVAFGRVAYPAISTDRLRARLTQQRLHQLKSLLQAYGPRD